MIDMKNIIKYGALSFTIMLTLVALASCIYDEIDPEANPDDNIEVPEDIQKGYSLTLAVTLDKMGGTAATRVALDPALYPKLAELEEIENYINPEKFRVFFFDDKDQFLFESKSRWVKLLSESGDNTSWLVAVPMFSYGNDIDDYDWDWTYIRKALTTASFKVAILANRPTEEYFPELEDNSGGGSSWFDNSGPFWTKDNADPDKPELRKSVFDFHHCQWDPIYESKSKPTRTVNNIKYSYTGEPFYYFVMGEAEQEIRPDGIPGQHDFPTMSATSSWVDWGTRGVEDNKNQNNWDTAWKDDKGAVVEVRKNKMPSKDYPIPMYGIQQFNQIENWTEGTPFNLSTITAKDDGYSDGYDHRSISLLRSVVRLDLMIPAGSYSKPQMVMLYYSNVYARCEPMDVWTPTDKIWNEAHGDFDSWGAENCEWKSIMYYGPMVRGGDPTIGRQDNSESRVRISNVNATKPSADLYRKRLSWFYGAWLDKNPATGESWWDFSEDAKLSKDKFGKENVVPEKDNTGRYRYPRIFNSCIQRNQRVSCTDNGYIGIVGGYHYFVVYTGERNMNDPAYQYDLGNPGSSSPTVIYWQVAMNNKIYDFPITDYGRATENYGSGAIESDAFSDRNAAVPNRLKDYLFNIRDLVSTEYKGPEETTGASPANYTIGDHIYADEDKSKNLPWPLLRNHVYRITIGGQPNPALDTRAGGGLSVTCEDLHSESIRFY